MAFIKSLMDYSGLFDRRRLDRIYGRISAISEGWELVSTINDLDVNIGFRFFGNNGGFTPFYWGVRMNRLINDDEAIQVLAHEVRHAWQYNQMGYKKGDRLDFGTDRLWTRMIEGDANAYKCTFMEALCLHEGRPMPKNTEVYRKHYERDYRVQFADAVDFVRSTPVEERMINHFCLAQVSFGKFYDDLTYKQHSYDQRVLGLGEPLSSAFSRAMTMDNLRNLCKVGFGKSAENYSVSLDDVAMYEITSPAFG